MGIIEAFGKFQIYGFVSVMFIISVIILIIGVLIIRRPDDTTHTSNVEGVHSNVVCVNNQCTSTIKYTVTKNTYTLADTFGNIKEGDKVTVYYDPKNPSDARAKPLASKTVGWIMLAISLFFILLTFFIGRSFYAASNNNRQSYARLAAVGGAARYL